MAVVVRRHDPLVGKTLADTYIVESVIGEGGMGLVYLARHTRISHKRFAIKTIHVEFARDEEVLKRFKREAEAAALITNRHVVGVYDYGCTPDGRPFLVCEYVVGEELTEQLQRTGPLLVAEAVHIARQVCLGLAAAHEQGVVHRDVKPENVLLVHTQATLIAKLFDFGTSWLDDGRTLTVAGEILGTLDYMSPEQALGTGIDHRADVYGVGMMLYVVLTDVVPFRRASAPETLTAMLTETAHPPSRYQLEIPPRLDEIILKAIAKKPCERFGTISALRDALAPFDPVVEHRSPGDSGSADDGGEFTRRLGLLVTVAVALFFAGLLALRGINQWADVDTLFALVAGFAAAMAVSLARRAPAP